ncbi:MAG: tryptophan synthase subunit alpha [Chloroflexi bacterium]|nr:tryptophan synthase subunit alpha [Chloroflexota bacterium]
MRGRPERRSGRLNEATAVSGGASMNANRIDAVFHALRAAGRMGLFPFFTAGYPTLEATERLALVALEAGADGLELGVPFSDPLADGATLQRASEVALRNGASLAWTLALTERLRVQVDAPIVLLTSFNPVHRYGGARFVDDAVRAGADGVIVADLPSGEAADLLEVAGGHGFYLIPMVAPTTTPERLEEVGRTARGFVYCVSLLGTTGARPQVSERVPAFMAAVRAHVSQPLLLGFGIARPEHIVSVRPYADAVAVGGAIADLLAGTPDASMVPAVRVYISRLRAACEAPSRSPAS